VYNFVSVWLHKHIFTYINPLSSTYCNQINLLLFELVYMINIQRFDGQPGEVMELYCAKIKLITLHVA
jgi:hypothetical protein